MDTFAFRKGLYLISNHLSSSEVTTLKFYLGDSLPRSQLEKAKTGFDIFCLMSAKNFLSPTNLSFLEDILDCIHKKHFLDKYIRAQGVGGDGHSRPVNLGAAQAAVAEPGRISSLRGFLGEIGAEMSQDNVHDLALFFHGDDVSVQDVERMRSAEELFDKLVTSHLLGPSNMHVLKDVLNVLGRRDLGSRVERYQQHGYPVRGGGSSEQTNQTGGHIPNSRPNVSDLKTPIAASDDPSPNDSLVAATPLRTNSSNSLASGFTAYTFSSMSSREDTASLPTLEEKDFGQVAQLSLSATEKDKRITQLQSEIEELKLRLKQTKSAPVVGGFQDHGLRAMLEAKNAEVESLRIEANKLREVIDKAPLYPMNQSPHGLAIIIVNGKFIRNPDKLKLELSFRRGAVKDRDLFTQTFKHLDFVTDVHENLSSMQMMALMDDVSKRDHSLFDSFVCCVSTHGIQHSLYGSDSVEVNREEFQGFVKNCPSLKNKPKLFFLQACRVSDVTADSPNSENQKPQLKPPTITHPDTDMLIANAATVGQSAYISPEQGSWFVKALQQKLTHKSLPFDRTLQQMLEEVTDRVSGSAGWLENGEQVRQCVEVSTTLRRGVKFFNNNKMEH